MKKSLIAATIATAVAGSALWAPAATAEEEQFFPLLSYRTGPFGGNGAPFANGQIDYMKLINAQGGVNGVMLTWEECETGYKTDVAMSASRTRARSLPSHRFPPASPMPCWKKSSPTRMSCFRWAMAGHPRLTAVSSPGSSTCRPPIGPRPPRSCATSSSRKAAKPI